VDIEAVCCCRRWRRAEEEEICAGKSERVRSVHADSACGECGRLEVGGLLITSTAVSNRSGAWSVEIRIVGITRDTYLSA
jgi:hypothetical protein